jgi:hypothetical protein
MAVALAGCGAVLLLLLDVVAGMEVSGMTAVVGAAGVSALHARVAASALPSPVIPALSSRTETTFACVLTTMRNVMTCSEVAAGVDCD